MTPYGLSVNRRGLTFTGGRSGSSDPGPPEGLDPDGWEAAAGYRTSLGEWYYDEDPPGFAEGMAELH